MKRNDVKWNLPSRYTVRKQIGSGAYGDVVAAYDHEEDKYVAVKRFADIFSDVIDCKRMLREISILSQLKNSLVVKLLDIVISEPRDSFKTLYLVLEIADSDIKKLIREPIQLNPLHTKVIMYNLLAALKVIHDHGIIHRDLKPANILLNKDCSIKICDFGLSRSLLPHGGFTIPHDDEVNAEILFDAPLPADKENYTRHVVTRWYRAPEVILVQPEYGMAIDVWSIGCIFAELLQIEKVLCNNTIFMPPKRSIPRQPLFPGSYCYPLSPKKQIDNGCDRTFLANDQLRMIFSVIGSPREDDIQWLDREDAREYIRTFRQYPPINFHERFHWVDKRVVDLMVSMLHFNPNKRISVDEALKHPYFDDIPNYQFPTESPHVEIAVDSDEYKNLKLTEKLILQAMDRFNGCDTTSTSDPTERRKHRSIIQKIKQLTL